ncbi:MAG: hypothetical protein ACK52I_08080 [Pseudomonadota bacterium]
MRRVVGPTARIYAWLEAHPDPQAWDALLAWVRAVAIDWEFCVSSEWVKPDTGRRFYLSQLPSARTCVVFTVVDTPARAIQIFQINDDLFEV